MTNRSTSADFVTAFATGWPEHQPDIMVLSLTTRIILAMLYLPAMSAALTSSSG